MTAASRFGPGPAAPLILASASPRRAEILHTLGIDHEVQAAHVDETVLPGEAPEAHAERLARAKAGAVAALRPGRWVLAGDTVVSVAGEIMGKPAGEDEAAGMLLRLAGREHRVVSALALVRPAGEVGPGGEERGAAGAPAGADPPPGARIFSGTQSTIVRFRPFGPDVARAYAATGEPMDKAGAYGIQGKGAALVEGVQGDYSGVVGLPVPLLLRLLDEAGRPYRFPGRPPHL